MKKKRKEQHLEDEIFRIGKKIGDLLTGPDEDGPDLDSFIERERRAKVKKADRDYLEMLVDADDKTVERILSKKKKKLKKIKEETDY
jgi:hypothetical protein